MQSDSLTVSGNDIEVVPEFGEHCGEINLGAGNAPNPCSVDHATNQVATLVNASGQRFETAFEFLGEGVVFQNKDGQVMLCNNAAAEILGLSLEELEGRTSVDPRWQSLKEDGTVFPGEQHPAMLALQTGERQKNVLMNVLKPNGSRIWIKINSVPIFDNFSTEPISVVTSFSDISTIKFEEEKLRAKLKRLQESQAQVQLRRRGLERANQELREASDIDSDTGLKNRRCFFERLCAEVSLASRKQIPLSILIGEILPDSDNVEGLDLSTGSEVLALVGDVLRKSCRISDFVARYNTEKFAVIMPHSTNDEAADFAERLFTEIQKGKGNVSLQACIGIAEYRAGWLTNEFLEQAEDALFRAKALGFNTCFSEQR